MTASLKPSSALNSPEGHQPLLGSKRLNLALLCFCGCALAYALRSNLSFAIVCMVREEEERNETVGAARKSSSAECPGVVSSAQRQRRQIELTGNETGMMSLDSGGGDLMLGEFDWPKQLQGHVLGAFFFGYLTSQMLGGLLAARIGAKIVLFASILASSLLSVLSPQAARFHVATFIGARALLGFTQGVMFPAMHSLWSGWAPPMERGVLTGISYAGAQVGNMLVMPLSGFLCRHGFAGGWPSIFYLLGAAGLIWCVVWMVCAADFPQTHRTIGAAERRYILQSLGKQCDDEEKSQQPIERRQRRKQIPLLSILTSIPVWAIFIGHFAGDWGSYTLALGLPSFLNDVLGMDMTSMGIISALPYLAYFAVINIGGHIADQLQQKEVLTTLNCRRLAMIVALGGQALLLVSIGYCGCGQDSLVILLLILAIGVSGFQYAGFVVNYLDICPELAGFVLGIGNTLSCLAGLISPILIGWLTPTGSKQEWLLVFYVTAFILIAGAVAFSLLVSADVQSWSKEFGGENDGEEEAESGESRAAISDLEEVEAAARKQKLLVQQQKWSENQQQKIPQKRPLLENVEEIAAESPIDGVEEEQQKLIRERNGGAQKSETGDGT